MCALLIGCHTFALPMCEYGSPGSDLIDSGVGSDIVAGDALSYSGAQGYSKADNYAHQGGRAGNVTIDTGAGSDLFSGDALTIETDSHDPVLGEYGPENDSAYAYNEASTQGQAGNDLIKDRKSAV